MGRISGDDAQLGYLRSVQCLLQRGISVNTPASLPTMYRKATYRFVLRGQQHMHTRKLFDDVLGIRVLMIVVQMVGIVFAIRNIFLLFRVDIVVVVFRGLRVWQRSVGRYHKVIGIVVRMLMVG
jgi:hypothetical protein